MQEGFDVPPQLRLRAICLLAELMLQPEARELECEIHSRVDDGDSYTNMILRAYSNARINPTKVDVTTVLQSNEAFIEGTIVHRINQNEQRRKQLFDEMLEEKYDGIARDTDKSYNSSLKCRRCNSSEVRWDQKQTRGADEAMTVFCACSTCGNRWTIR